MWALNISSAAEVIEEEGRLNALRVTGGSGGYGLTHGCKVDRSTVKDLCLGNLKSWGGDVAKQGLSSWTLYLKGG